MKIVKYLFYFTAVVFIFGQLLSVTIPTYPEVKIHLIDIVVGLTTGAWFTLALYSAKVKKHLTNQLGKSILIFIGAAVISIAVNIINYKSYQLIIGSLYIARFAAYAGLYFVIRDLTAKTTLSRVNPLKRGRIRDILIGAGVISGILGLAQYFLYPNLRNLQYLGWDPHYKRVFGTFLDPQFIGVVLVITLIILIGQNKTNKAYIIAISVISAALLLTFSRSSYLALAGGLTLHHMGCRVRKLWKLGLLGILFCAFIFYAIKPEGIGADLLRKKTAIARINSWKEAVEIWKKKPFFGVGFNMYRYAGAKNIKGADNSFLFVLAATGLVGLAAYLNFWRKLMGKIYYKTSKTHIAVVAALFIHASFNNTLFYPHIMWLVSVYFSSSEE